MIDGVRDEVLADKTVRRGATDEERTGEKPEVRRADGPSHDAGIWRPGGGERALGGPQRTGADLGGIVAQPDEHRDDEQQDDHPQHHSADSPADRDRQSGEDREEHQLARAVARAEDADHEAAVLHEPAGGDGRAEDAGHEAGAEP